MILNLSIDIFVSFNKIVLACMCTRVHNNRIGSTALNCKQANLRGRSCIKPVVLLKSVQLLYLLNVTNGINITT